MNLIIKPPVPAYRRIQKAIHKRIQSGELQTGDLVDSERDLARIHGVSLMTARQALKELEAEGLVERRRGAGTFVAQPRIHFNRLVSFTEQMASRGFSAHSRLLCARLVNGDDEVTARLGLAPDAKLVRLERLRMADGQPFAIEVCFLAADPFRDLLEASLERHSLFTLLEQKHGIQLAYADEEVDAIAATRKMEELLKVPRGTPLLRISQILFNTGGVATAYSLALYRSDRYSLLTRRYR